MGDPKDERPAGEQPDSSLPSPEDIQAFVEQHIPTMVLEVFPDWQGFLVQSSAPKASVWIVRTRKEGQRLHQLTGKPALLLTDVLAQKGRDFAEARKTLLRQIIRAPLPPTASHEGEEYGNKIHDCAVVEEHLT